MNNKILARVELEKTLNNWMQPELFDDYCPNGLQIEGRDQIKKIAFAVSATYDSVEKAAAWQADTLIVHHGLFWKFHGAKTLTGPFFKRVAPLIKQEINLFGYHLPLDGHIEFGNAKALADVLGLQDTEPFGLYKKTYIGIKGKFAKPITAAEIESLICEKLNRAPLVSIPDSREFPNSKLINSMGIITGGARDDWSLSLKDGLDAYLTGEMSEHHYHESRESGITMFAAGHHATEKFGILALKQKIEQTYPYLETIYIDSNNPA